MGGWRGEYTRLEWLQMAFLFFGMPLAAILGSLLGMAGRWKQGRVLSAALVGMGGAAFVSAILFLAFLSIPLLATDERKSILLDLFDWEFGEQLTRNAVIATAVISLLAALGMRLRDRKPTTSATSVSLRQLLLLQLFSFAALGCWTGMRFVALESVSGYERAYRKWAPLDWTVVGNGDREPVALTRTLFSLQANAAEENANLKLAAAEPWLRELALGGIDDPAKLNLGLLRNAKSLKTLTLALKSPALVGDTTVDQLGAIESLESLTISGGKFTTLDLQAWSRPPKLKSLKFVRSTLSPLALEGLAKSASLTDLDLQDVEFNGPEGLFIPQNLVGLRIHSSRATRELESLNLRRLGELRRLSLWLPRITRQQLEAISTLPKIETLHLQNIAAPGDLQLLLANRTLKRLSFRVSALPPSQGSFLPDPYSLDPSPSGPYRPGSDSLGSGNDYRPLLLLLGELPELSSLTCEGELLFGGDPPTIEATLSSGDPYAESATAAIEAEKRAIEREVQSRKAALQQQIDARREGLQLKKLLLELAPFEPEIIWRPKENAPKPNRLIREEKGDTEEEP